MVKERYKDDSIDISDASAKVRALIIEHLIDLGINPKIPPTELLSPDFLKHVRKHSSGDPSANTLDKWLAGPEQLVPGGDMAFQLVKADERAEIIL